jgi:cystathionine beta-lyase/cystathionine gamma-synthase
MTHGAIPAAEARALGIVDGFIRISVGLEDEADLRADLSRALEAAGAAR